MQETRCMSKITARIILLGLVCLLVGCVSVNPPPEEQYSFKTINAATRQTQISQLRFWGVNGSFSLVYPEHTPIIAAFTWRQLGRNQFYIRVSSSLDLYNIYITKEFGSVTLWKTATEFYKAKSPEVLMERELRWSLPLSNLYYWIRGIPAPGKKVAHYDKYGHLIDLQQQGWNIECKFYETVYGLDLPRVIIMERPGYAIKIAIKHWFLFMHKLEVEDSNSLHGLDNRKLIR